MIQQSVLLQLIQFVGLITPALAILIELLVRFHGGLGDLSSDKELPFEIQVLFLGFSAILLGGTIIGIQFGLGLDDPVTQMATLLVFGGLPLLAVSVIAINVRISGVSDPTSSLLDNTILSIKYALSIVLPAILSAILFFGAVYYLRQGINSLLNWWIFRGLVEPVWYFYVISTIAWYKSMYSLWRQSLIPAMDYRDALGEWFVVSLTVGTLIIVLSGSVFGVYYILTLTKIPFMTKTSVLSAIPYLWSVIVILAILLNKIDSNED